MGKGFVPPKYRVPHYSTRLCRAQYQYLAKYYDKSIFESACQELGVPVEYLLKDENWVSNAFFADFIEIVKRSTGDENIAEKFGTFSVIPEVVNPIEYAVNRAVLFPTLFYLGVPVQYRRYNYINKIKLLKWGPGYFYYQVTPAGKDIAHPDVCKNAKGMLESTKNFFELDEANVVHTRCIHNGAPHCEFEVRYKATTFWKKRFLSLLGFGVGVGGSFALLWNNAPFFRESWLSQSLFLCSYTLLIAFLTLGKRYLSVVKYIQQYNEQSRSKAKELFENYEKLDRRYHESNVLRGLAHQLLTTNDPNEVVKICVQELDKRFGYSRSIFMLLSGDKDRLYTAEVGGFESGMQDLRTLSLKYPSERGNPLLFANILESGETKLVQNLEKFKESLTHDNSMLVNQLKVNSLVATPLQDDEEKYGLLIIGSLGEEHPLTQDDRHMIESVGRLVSISFRDARNFDREKSLRKIFQKYVPEQVLDGLDQLGSNAEGLVPKQTYLTSLFVDLRGFTKRCEYLPPEQVVELLNLYSDFITTRIAAGGGIIDKLLGDGVNAFFPTEEKNWTRHTRAALVSALLVLADLDQLEQQFKERGYGDAHIGIGLHRGTAIVGNMGSDRRLDYTAVGDTINVAARLEALSKDYAQKESGVILLTQNTYSWAHVDVGVIEIGSVPIRGRKAKEDLVLITQKAAVAWVKKHSLNTENLKTVIQDTRGLDGERASTKKAA